MACQQLDKITMVFFSKFVLTYCEKNVLGIDKNFEAEDQKFAKFSKLVEQFFYSRSKQIWKQNTILIKLLTCHIDVQLIYAPYARHHRPLLIRSRS